MTDAPTALVICDPRELPDKRRVWGTGGWLPPEEREALDWITLFRLLGWSVAKADTRGPPAHLDLTRIRYLIIGCSLDSLNENWDALLRRLVDRQPVLVVARATDRSTPLSETTGALAGNGTAHGRSLSWIGPGKRINWSTGTPINVVAIQPKEGIKTWATLNGLPAVVVKDCGRGRFVTLAFHPSVARDADGAATSLLRHLLVWGTGLPTAWLNLEGCLVLRMDDPGGSPNVHWSKWAYHKLDERQWTEIGNCLSARDARMTIAYIPGWVDDGDSSRGSLWVGERKIPRTPGAVHASPLILYSARSGDVSGKMHDYRAEYRGIQKLRRAAVAEVELHGYTHMHPNATAWAKAKDRCDAEHWFREFGPHDEPVRGRIEAAISIFERHFSVYPTTLIPPGDQWTDETLAEALDLGLSLVASYHLAIRLGSRFCWAAHVCAPYLDLLDSAWLTSGLPVVGYFHDRDLARPSGGLLAARSVG